MQLVTSEAQEVVMLHWQEEIHLKVGVYFKMAPQRKIMTGFIFSADP